MSAGSHCALNKLRFMASDCLAETTHCRKIITTKLVVHHCTYHYLVIPARAFLTVILSSLRIREGIMHSIGIICGFVIHNEQ